MTDSTVAGHDALPDQNAIRLGVALLCLAGFCALALKQFWGIFAPDLSALYMAGHLFATGQFDLIYAAPDTFFGGPPDEWLPLLPAIGLEGREVLPYVYPPLWAAVVAPLTETVGPWAFFKAATVIEMATLVACVFLSWRICRKFAMPLWMWVLISTVLMASSVITFSALMHLQPQIIVLGLTMLAFERYSAGKPGTAGAVLGMAAMLKLAPAGLALIFLLDRNWRALSVFTSVCAALTGLNFLIAGPALIQAFFDSMAHASSGLFILAAAYSVEILVYGAASAVDLVPPIDMTARNLLIGDSTMIVQLITKALLLVSLGWAVVRTHRAPDSHQLATRLMLFSLLINLFGPLNWVHYYLPQLFLLPALIGLLPRVPGTVMLVAVGVLTSWALTVQLRQVFSGDFPFAAIGGATMLLLFLAILIGARPNRPNQQAPLTPRPPQDQQ